jgi:hypothetical protein
LLAERAGHPIPKIDYHVVMQAVVASFGGNERPLAELILRLI